MTSDERTAEARLRSYVSQRRVLQGLLARAVAVRDALAVQARLASVDEEVEMMRSSLERARRRRSFASVTVQIGEPGAIARAGARDPSFANAWRTSLDGLERMGTAAMIGSLWLSPFVALALAALWIRRARRAPQEA